MNAFKKIFLFLWDKIFQATITIVFAAILISHVDIASEEFVIVYDVKEEKVNQGSVYIYHIDVANAGNIEASDLFLFVKTWGYILQVQEDHLSPAAFQVVGRESDRPEETFCRCQTQCRFRISRLYKEGVIGITFLSSGALAESPVLWFGGRTVKEPRNQRETEDGTKTIPVNQCINK